MSLKGKIITPRDYQERIVAYIEKLGDSDSFTVGDCVRATGVPLCSVQISLRGRRSRGELDGELVDGVWLYARKSDPKIICEPRGLVAELVWATLKEASPEEELTLPEIVRRIEANRRQLFSNAVICSDLCVWYHLGYLLRDGECRQYRYRLTDAARQLPERPVIPLHRSSPQTEAVQEPHAG